MKRHIANKFGVVWRELYWYPDCLCHFWPSFLIPSKQHGGSVVVERRQWQIKLVKILTFEGRIILSKRRTGLYESC